MWGFDAVSKRRCQQPTSSASIRDLLISEPCLFVEGVLSRKQQHGSNTEEDLCWGMSFNTQRLTSSRSDASGIMTQWWNRPNQSSVTAYLSLHPPVSLAGGQNLLSFSPQSGLAGQLHQRTDAPDERRRPGRTDNKWKTSLSPSLSLEMCSKQRDKAKDTTSWMTNKTP